MRNLYNCEGQRPVPNLILSPAFADYPARSVAEMRFRWLDSFQTVWCHVEIHVEISIDVNRINHDWLIISESNKFAKSKTNDSFHG